ncbi:MAG TPA: hypothetical protein VID50_07500 [Candidatus Eisenbacteria bacterium]
MLRVLLSVLAAFVAARVLFGLIQAVAAGLREGSAGSSTRRPRVDRETAIDVPYTEVEAKEPSGPGRERRAG